MPHNIFEGIAIDIVCNIITILVLLLLPKGKLFRIDFANGKIESFEYSRIDKNNKPQHFKIISPSNFKIKETACEM